MKMRIVKVGVGLILLPLLRTVQDYCHSCNGTRIFIYPEDYNKGLAPYPKTTGKEALTIFINMGLWSISEISLKKQDIEADLILTIHWFDPRLTVLRNVSADGEWVRVGEEAFNIWRPTLMFRNCKGCSSLSVGGGTVPLFIHEITGVFWVQHRIVTRFNCAINLRSYPMDVQNCAIQLYTNERARRWLVLQHNSSEKYTQISSGLTLSEFTIPSIEKTYCNVIEASGSSFSCIELNIKFIRRLAYHFTTCYAPTAFIVILSWISFWLPVDSVPARIALGLTSLLTLATRLDHTQANLPPVSYVKAIDVWMFACIFLVSVSLLEFAISYYLFRQNKKMADLTVEKTRSIQAKQVDAFQVDKETPSNLPEPQDSDNSDDSRDSLQTKEYDGTLLERISRILFPIFFMVFNIVYWSYYLS